MRCPLLLLCILSVGTSSLAADRSAEERLERMERALQQLQQRNSELEEKVRRLEAREVSPENRAAAVESRTPPAPPASPGRKAVAEVQAAPIAAPESIESPSSSGFDIRLSGFVQMQADAGDVSAFIGRFSQTPAFVISAGEVNDRLLIRRARLTVAGDYAEQFEFKFELELFSGANSSARVTDIAARDVSVNWRATPEANIKLGQFKAPFGFEQLTSDSRLLSIEPSLVTTALAPDRQIGVQLWGQPLARLWPGHGNALTYYVGMFNGSGSNTSINDNSEFMYVGRVEVQALKSQILNQPASVRVGVNGLSSRDENGTRVSPAIFVNQDGSLAGFDISPPGGREAYGFDATLRVGPFEVTGEYLKERIYPRGSGRFFPRPMEFQPQGYYVQGSYFLIPDKMQLLAKWETLDPDQLPDDDIHSITAGVNYYLRGHDLKLMANYIHTWSDFRAANPQFGRDEFDQVSLRLQVMF